MPVLKLNHYEQVAVPAATGDFHFGLPLNPLPKVEVAMAAGGYTGALVSLTFMAVRGGTDGRRVWHRSTVFLNARSGGSELHGSNVDFHEENGTPQLTPKEVAVVSEILRITFDRGGGTPPPLTARCHWEVLMEVS